MVGTICGFIISNILLSFNMYGLVFQIILLAMWLWIFILFFPKDF